MRHVLLFCLCAVLLCFSGCKKQQNSLSPVCHVYSGADQCAFPGEKYARPLFLKCTNAQGAPLPGIRIAVTPILGSDLKTDQNEYVTDAGGMIPVRITAGRHTGDNILRIVPNGLEKNGITVRFVNGIRIHGGEQEVHAGSRLSEKIGIEVVDSRGKPIRDLPVTMRPEKLSVVSSIESGELKTDGKGKALTSVRAGKKTGEGFLNIDFPDPKFDAPVRTLKVRILSLNIASLIIGLLGGMALFIFGMKQMSEGLTQVAGARMRAILKACSRNRFVAVLAGTVVTAVIHSGATTVMAIGFVNAGLLTLEQSIGIVFGANIGTTILAQLIAFDTALLVMPSLILGLMLYFMPSPAAKGWGRTVLGFGFLFFGMGIMSSDLRSIGNFPSFIEFFRTFRCAPIDGSMPVLNVLGAVGIGIVATALIQSSTAVTGILIALGASGLVDLYTSVMLILGSNIGTTITAMIASIPANRVAKQTALAHMLFNVTGVLLVVLTFPFKWGGVPVFFKAVSLMADGDVFAEIPQNLPRHIANAHLLFNVLTTILLLPFVNQLAWLCRKIIPMGKEKVKFQLLEQHLLDQPALALEQTVAAVRKMVSKSWKMVYRSVKNCFLPVKLEEEIITKIRKREAKVDLYQSGIMEYLSLIMRRKLTRQQTEMIPPLMHCTNDAERIADRAENIVELTRRMQEASSSLSDAAKEELNGIFTILQRQEEAVKKSLDSYSERAAEEAARCEKELAKMAAESELNHISRLKCNRCSPETGIIYVELLGELLAVSRHLSNISERSIRYQFHAKER